MDNTQPKKTELEKYEDWIDQMLMKGKYTNTDYGQIASPAEWTKYNVLLSLVLNLYQDKYGKEKDYHENKPEIDSVIREAVAMTRFYTSQELSQSYQAGERAERKRIIDLINDPKNFTWIDIEGMSLIKEITKFLSPKENEE